MLTQDSSFSSLRILRQAGSSSASRSSQLQSFRNRVPRGRPHRRGLACFVGSERGDCIGFRNSEGVNLTIGESKEKGSVVCMQCRIGLVYYRLGPTPTAQVFCIGETNIFKCVESVSLWYEGNGSFRSLKIGSKGDELLVAFLSATVILINACEVEQLQNILRSLSEAFLRLLKEIWAKVSDHVVMNAAMKSNEGGDLCKSNIGVSNLAESIFRLSVDACQLSVSLPFEVVKGGLFGTSDTSFEDFLSSYWEVSPFLLRSTLKDPNVYDMFSPFIKSLSWTGSLPSLLSSILQGLVSCFPIASDEQNIFNFLNEVKDRLGCPIIYQQDIRVVKTERQSRKEMHYFQDFHPGCIKEPQYFTIDDVLKCGQAYKEGYTVALRGLEFRYQNIAAIAETLALMFGQPSVGANLYLTPPNSQGLACHFDDHCVFVYQIFGSKHWTVFSQPRQLLPRLYDDLHGSDIDCTKAGRREFFLREGDVLYIPRGFPHEAYTNSGVGDGSPGFSLHLTLSIEVEPPFE